MNANNGAIHFEALLTKEQFDKAINDIKNQIRGVSATATAETAKVDDSFKTLAKGIGAYFSGRMLWGLTQEIINVRGEFQKTEIAFGTMLKSSEKAKSLMRDMVDLAARTPFALTDVTDGAKRLLAFQVPAEQVVETLTRIGNVAAGVGVPMGQLIHVYGQVKAQGKLMTNDLYQFMNAGIPMVAELAKVMGVAENEVKDLISAGKIGFPEVQKVIQNLTDEGGLFFNLMEKQSESLTGKISNLQDTISQIFNEIGESNEGLLNSGLDGITYIVENYEVLLDILKVLVVTYGTYKAALIAVSAAQKAQNIAGAINLYISLAKEIRTARDAQVALNLVSKANPYILLASAIMAIASAVIVFSSETGKLTAKQKALNDVNDEAEKNIISQKNELKRLTDVAKNENLEKEKRIDAIKKLNQISPQYLGDLTLESIKTQKATIAIEAYIDSLRQVQKEKALMAKMDELAKQRVDLKSSTIEDYYGASNVWGVGNKLEGIINGLTGSDLSKTSISKTEMEQLDSLSVKNLANALRKYTPTIIDAYKKRRKALDENQEAYNSIAKETHNQIEKNINSQKKELDAEKQVIQDKKYFLNERKKIQNKLKDALNVGDVGTAKELKKQLSEIDNTLALWGDKPTRASKSKSIVDEILPKGSIAELEKRLSKINEAINKSNSEAQIQKLLPQRIALEKQIAEARAKIEIKTANQIIDEKLKKWELYYKAKERYGADSEFLNAEFFKGLKDNEDSLVEYIKKELEKIEQLDKPTLIDVENFEKLSEALRNITGEKSNLDKFKGDLERIKEESEDSYEYLEKLAEIKKKLSEDNSPTGIAKINIIKDEEDNATKENAKQLQEFLNQIKDFQEQRIEIEERFRLLRTEAEKLEGEEKIKALEKINQAQEEELSKVNVDELKLADDWKIAFEGLEKHSRTAVKKAISNLKELAKAMLATGKISQVEYAKLMGDLNKLSNDTKNKLDDIANAFSKAFKDGFNLEGFGELLNLSRDALNTFGSDAISVFESITGESGEMASQILGDITNIVDGFGDIAKGIASGNPVTVLSGIAKVVKTISDWASGDRGKERKIKKHEQAVKSLQNAYDQLAHSLKNTVGDAYYTHQEDSIKNLEQQKEHLRQMTQQEKHKKRTDQNKIAEYEKAIQDIDHKIEDTVNEMGDALLQTNFKEFAKQMEDALVGAFKNGQNAVEAMGQSIDDMIEGAVRHALRMKFLEEPIKKYLDKLNKEMKGADGKPIIPGTDFLSKWKAELQQQLSNSADVMKATLDNLGLLDKNAKDLQGMRGAIQGVTEETAGIIEGQMNAIRINGAERLQISRESLQIDMEALKELSSIREYTSHLINISGDLYEVLKIIKQNNGKKI